MKEYSKARREDRTFRALTVIWSLLTTILLLLPGSNFPDPGLSGTLETALEWGVHLILFLVLAYLARRGYAGSSGPPESIGTASARRRRSRVLAAVLAYCTLLEILQIAIPGRGFEVTDIVIGCLGAVLGFRGRG